MTSHFSLTRRQAFAGTDGKRTTGAVKVILVILFAANVYDTAGSLGVKYAVFLMACVFSLSTLKDLDLSLREITAGLLLFVVWPIWALLYGVVRGGDPAVGLTQVTPFLFALVLALILPALDSRVPLRLYYACIFSLSVIVVVSFGLVFLFPENPVSVRVFSVLTGLHERVGFFGSHPLGDVDVPLVYFRSTLFLVPTCVYYLFVDKMLRAGVVFLALAVTWSKAGIFIVLAFGLAYLTRVLFWRTASAPRVNERRTGWRGYFRTLLPVVMLVGIASLVLISFPGFSGEITDTATGESESALIRIGHYRSMMALFSRDPSYLLVGQGAGVPFFTSGISEYVNTIELDHLDTIRKFGLPWFLGFSSIVFLSAWRLIKAKDMEMQAFGLALVSMYFAAGTNPVLLTPLFIMLMTLSYFAQRTVNGRTSSRTVGDL